MAPWCGCDKAFHQRRNWQLRCQLPQLHPWLHIIDSYWIYLDIKRLFVGLIVTVVSSKPRAQRLDQNQIPAAISQEFCQANQHLTSTIAVGGWISRWVFSSLRSHRNDAGWNSNSLLLAAIFWEHLGRMEDAAVTTGEVEFHASYRCISHRSGAKMDLQWFLEGTSLGHLRSHHGARVQQEDQKRAPFGTTRPSMITEALMLRVQCPGKKKVAKIPIATWITREIGGHHAWKWFPNKNVAARAQFKKKNGKLQPHK